MLPLTIGKSQRMKKLFLLAITCLFFNVSSHSGEISTSLPAKIDPAKSYVFYSHGFIVEGTDPMPVNPKWGVYDFPAVKNSLSDADYHLIATHRPAKTHPLEYAKSLANQVNKLITSGVPAHQIALIGFSRGGFITAITSSYLKNSDVNFVILAACTRGLANRKEVTIHGHLLSIYETSDSVGSCDNVVARTPDTVTSYKEISISTGKDHGAFYRPIPQWIIPVKKWIKSQITN